MLDFQTSCKWHSCSFGGLQKFGWWVVVYYGDPICVVVLENLPTVAASDCTLCLLHHQRNLLGAQLSPSHFHPWRQGAAAAHRRPLDSLLPRLSPPATPPACHLRHFRWPWRLHWVHEGVHHHWLTILSVWRWTEYGHQQVLVTSVWSKMVSTYSGKAHVPHPRSKRFPQHSVPLVSAFPAFQPLSNAFPPFQPLVSFLPAFQPLFSSPEDEADPQLPKFQRKLSCRSGFLVKCYVGSKFEFDE